MWEWQDEAGQWIRYDSDTTAKLEEEFSREGGEGKGKVAISAAGRAYSIDLVKMEQTNIATGAVRQVRRLKPVSKTSSQGGEEPGKTWFWRGVCVCVCVCMCVRFVAPLRFCCVAMNPCNLVITQYGSLHSEITSPSPLSCGGYM